MVIYVISLSYNKFSNQFILSIIINSYYIFYDS